MPDEIEEGQQMTTQELNLAATELRRIADSLEKNGADDAIDLFEEGYSIQDAGASIAILVSVERTERREEPE